MASRILLLTMHCAVALTVARSQPVSVLVVTGGKSFDTASFHGMFSSFERIAFDTASKPGVFSLFASDSLAEYDAMVFYDTYQAISQTEKAAFLRLFDRGIGCVFLHHALVSHQEWPEYERIVGGRYHHASYVKDGKKYGPSTYRHDQDFTVVIVDPMHPVTRGMSDFTIHDETYINYQIFKTSTPLLRTDYRDSGEIIGWTNGYRRSRVVYLQPGHDLNAYLHPSFRSLVHKAILWVAEASKSR